MIQRTILVCGLPRCGSSLTMAMLALAGVEVLGQAPAYEDEHTRPGHVTAEWLNSHPGKAIKVLSPEMLSIDVFDRQRFVVIFLSRDPDQQAKSGFKFMEWATGRTYGTSRAQRRKAAADNVRDTDRGIKLLRASGCPLLVMPFERLIGMPDVAATEIVAFLEPFIGRLNPYLMSRLVMRRSPRCLPYMLEDGQNIDRVIRGLA